MAKKFSENYKRAWVGLYAFLYIPWFLYLEKHVTTDFHLIHVGLDDKIPFIEFFIVPYLLWFAYIAVTIGYFLLFGKKTEFYRMITLLFSGMTIFLIISTLYPNGLKLRPDTFARDNIFVDMVKNLYATDTSTNVLPSIHVYNSIAAYLSIANCEKLQKVKWVQISSLILTILIVLSTMFLKQHSVVDVIAGCALVSVLYILIYKTERTHGKNLSNNLVKIRRLSDN